MDELFRMITLRAPNTPDSTSAVSLTTNSTFQASLAAITGTPSEKARAIKQTGSRFETTGDFLSDISKLNYGSATKSALATLSDSTKIPASLAALSTFLQQTFGVAPATVVADPKFSADQVALKDTAVAAYVAPVTVDILTSVSAALGLFAVLQRAAANDASLNSSAAISAALSPTFVLPSPTFPLSPTIIAPVGIGDLLVVRQHILRYEPVDIAYVENILSGETRGHTTKHDLETVQTTLTENQVTTTTFKDLQTTDQSALQTETQNVLQQSLNATAGVAISASYGSLQIATNANVAYSNSQQSSNEVATQTAHQVVNQAATNVTNMTLNEQSTTVTEKFKTDDSHTFANPSPNPNVVGVYQWINEIDRAQVFNYGKRMLYDLIVPEPAAFLIDAATTQAATSNTTLPAKPKAFTLTPATLSADPTSAAYFGIYANQYGAVGIPDEPAGDITVTKAFNFDGSSTGGQGATDITIPDDYHAEEAYVQANYNYTGNKQDSGLNVFVGTTSYSMIGQAEAPGNANPRPLTAHKEATSISVAIHTWQVHDYAVNVDIKCKLSAVAKAAWMEKVFDTIYTAYQSRLKEYNDAIAQQQFNAPTVGPLGSANPDENRVTERIEIKKSCIAMLSNIDILGFHGITQDVGPTGPATPPAFPRVNWPPAYGSPPPDVLGQGSLIRFFEQAFEWEEMMYLFYPYFWGRKSTWYANAMLTNADPLFELFLSAGACRAVIPVRPGFEGVVQYYMTMGGELWGGAGLPTISDPTYLPIAQEIADTEGAPGDEVAVGDPWEVTIPTQQVILTGPNLPAWTQPDPTQWVWTLVPTATPTPTQTTTTPSKAG